MKLGLILPCLAFASVLLHPPAPVRAQEPEPVEEEKPAEKELSPEEMRKMLLRQQKIIEAQQELIETHGKALLMLQTQLDELRQKPPELSDSEIAVRERLQAIESKMQADTNDVEDSDEEFPGSIKIPGTNMAFKVGGFVNLTGVSSIDPIGTGDRFVTATIPVTDEDPGEAGTEVIVNRTRLNFDWRMKSQYGQFRAFMEGDFRGVDANGNDVWRLRHAFGQFKDLTLGQTWTTFQDTRNRPEEIDLEGLNGQVNLRQPLGRIDFQGKRSLRWSLALEDPALDLTGAASETQIPDLVGRALWDLKDRRSHLSLVLRSLRSQGDLTSGETADSTELGFGLSGGTSIPIRRWNEKDGAQVQVTLGRGIGHYINDLRAEGGQDAVFDSETGTLEPLPVTSGFVSFQHWWREALRSTISFGWVYVDNLDFQMDDAYHRTYRGTANFIWSPISNIDLGAEVLYGKKENKDGQDATALQFQFASYFRF